MSGKTVIGNNGFQVKQEEMLLDTSPPEPLICETFGCKKRLTLYESLIGNKCYQCSNTPKEDINKHISV